VTTFMERKYLKTEKTLLPYTSIKARVMLQNVANLIQRSEAIRTRNKGV